MNARAYLVISGIIFGIVGVLHLLRVLNEWAFQLGPWSFPMWVSWFATVVAAILCVWAFRLAQQTR